MEPGDVAPWRHPVVGRRGPVPGCSAAFTPPQRVVAADDHVFDFQSYDAAKSITDWQFRSLLRTRLAMLRCTNSSPGSRPTISLAGTRLSEQPIQRKGGDWLLNRWATKSGSKPRVSRPRRGCFRTAVEVRSGAYTLASSSLPEQLSERQRRPDDLHTVSRPDRGILRRHGVGLGHLEEEGLHGAGGREGDEQAPTAGARPDVRHAAWPETESPGRRTCRTSPTSIANSPSSA